MLGGAFLRTTGHGRERMLFLIGAGGHGKVVLEALLLIEPDVRVLDAAPSRVGGEILGRTIEAEDSALDSLARAVDFVVGVGGADGRQRVVDRWEALGHRLTRAIHPKSSVSPWARVEPGAVVMAGAVVQAGAVIGRGAIVNTGATVDHDCRIGDYAHICPGTNLAGDVVIGPGAWIGIGSAVREGVTVGPRCLVGAGAVVVSDLPGDVVAYGNPCRVIRSAGQ